MRWFVFMTFLVAVCGVVAQAETYVVVNKITTAQADAEQMARTGILKHCGRNGGRREGIGFSTVSADDAVKRCCFYGKYRIVERGVARGPRGWFAVLRYE
jgi:hypothetical protein